MVIYRLGLPYYKEFDNFLFANLPFERGEILFSKGFSVYTDIRKLQDKAKTSYTLSTRRPRFGYESQFSRSTPGACFGNEEKQPIAH